MDAILYLYKHTIINRIKKAIKKPVTYICLVIFIFYFVMIFSSFGTITETMGINNGQGLSIIATVSVFLFVPGNLISYSKKKGLLFRNSDIHFLFPAPISAKGVLLYAHVKTIAVNFLVSIVLTIGGILWFDMPIWKMVVFFIFSCIVENLMEAAMMILMYGNERLSEKQTGLFRWLMYSIIAVFVIIAVATYISDGMSFGAVINYLNSPAIVMVPIIGWYIAFVRLLFLVPTMSSVVFSVAYFITALGLVCLAYKMKCTGQYYENATKFAEDYEEAKTKSQKGEMAIMGRKAKYKDATVTYKGKNAKALFYRQLLEYKKRRFFIFGPYTLLCLAAGIGIAVLGGKEGIKNNGAYFIVGVMAYLTFIFSSYLGKWGIELEKPYTYLLPDTPFRKLWYATLIEHIRSFVDGCLLTLPGAIVFRLSIIEFVLIVIVYICLQACKLYCGVMVEAIMGNVLGNVGKQFARILFEGIVIGFGVVGAAVGTLLVSREFGFITLIIVSLLLTGAAMIIAAFNFERMEDHNA